MFKRLLSTLRSTESAIYSYFVRSRIECSCLEQDLLKSIVN